MPVEGSDLECSGLRIVGVVEMCGLDTTPTPAALSPRLLKWTTYHH